jgi:8-amino-7-oxononanoate synthase
VADWLLPWLREQQQHRAAAGLTRRLVSRGPGPAAQLDLSGNDYLGLAGHSRLRAAAARAVQEWGTGATGSRLVTGTTALHRELEDELASWCGMPSALVFSSGYLANVGVVQALGGPDALVVSDAHNHASLVDACRLSRARVAVVAHGDVGAVERALAARTERRALVLSESVFSVLGDAAPLEELAEVCARHGAVLLVDEAHGLGVVGRGRGAVAAAGLAAQPHVVVTVTLSKALGSQGGAVLGPAELRDHLVNTARAFIFDTALAPAAAAAALEALRLLAQSPERVARCRRVAALLAAATEQPVPAGAVLSVPIGAADAALAATARCAEQGVRVACFRPPSTPDDVSRLRMTASAALSDADAARAGAVVVAALRAGAAVR